MEVGISKRIAIIGAGFFGCAVAKKLSMNGHEVTIYEKSSDILRGTSSANVYRVHRGPHYPRSIETASQCIDGYQKYCDEFSEAVFTDFPNYYLISSNGSHVDLHQFFEFCSKLEIPYSELMKADIPQKFSNCDGGVLCQEGTINLFKMRDHFRNVFTERGIELILNEEINSISKLNGAFTFNSNNHQYQSDIVVNCTFNNMNLGLGDIHHSPIELKYQKTVCFKCKTDAPLFGLTVMDGKFPTIFPTFWSKNSKKVDSFILYHVKHSVCREEISIKYPELEDIHKDELDVRYKKTLDRVEEFIPSFRDNVIDIEYLVGDRVLRANVETTDMRLSEIINPVSGYFIVFQGKIDYSLNLAEEISALI